MKKIALIIAALFVHTACSAGITVSGNRDFIAIHSSSCVGEVVKVVDVEPLLLLENLTGLIKLRTIHYTSDYMFDSETKSHLVQLINFNRFMAPGGGLFRITFDRNNNNVGLSSEEKSVLMYKNRKKNDVVNNSFRVLVTKEGCIYGNGNSFSIDR